MTSSKFRRLTCLHPSCQTTLECWLSLYFRSTDSYIKMVPPLSLSLSSFHCFSKSILSCKIFEHFARQTDPVTEFIKLGSAPFKEGTNLVPKLANPLSLWISGSTPSKTRSSNLIWINSYFLLYKDVS